MNNSKSFVLGFSLGLLLLSISVLAQTQFRFSGTLVVPEKESVQIEGLNVNDGLYQLTFDSLSQSETTASFTLNNEGSANVTLSLSSVDLASGLKMEHQIMYTRSLGEGRTYTLYTPRVPDGSSFTIQRGESVEVWIVIYDIGASPGTYEINLILEN